MSAVPFIQPVPYHASSSRSGRFTTPYPRSIGAARKFAQGAGSALLVFAGADSMTDSASAAATGSPPITDFSSLEGLTQTVLAGGLSGPLQIIVAAFLFLAAGRCVSRFLGLAVAASVLFLYMQGVTLQDAWMFAEHFTQRLTAAASAFQTAEVK